MKPLINNKNVDIEFSALIIQRLENLKMHKKSLWKEVNRKAINIMLLLDEIQDSQS
jgi:hypothetical protein